MCVARTAPHHHRPAHAAGHGRLEQESAGRVDIVLEELRVVAQKRRERARRLRARLVAIVGHRGRLVGGAGHDAGRHSGHEAEFQGLDADGAQEAGLRNGGWDERVVSVSGCERKGRRWVADREGAECFYLSTAALTSCRKPL